MEELYDLKEICGELYLIAKPAKGKSFIFEKLVEDAKKKGYNIEIK